ncbi:uncharacterized protein LOC129595801 [Paramacrobiotus metropolitanus]|uniref:uncharacterized protein LOC129595801 n=1 Tax=Paramacrobiotus metropolitanus TaxID=2943436 RepID=UPI002445D448|nr:uncharacterized protein LOC129595801 [Paramacrobiotus metropolitanus]
MEKPRTTHAPIIQSFNFRLGQLFGTFPYRYPWASATTPPPVNIPLACWSAALLTALLTCVVPWTGGLATMYKHQLAKLEFFAIVSFIFKITIYLQGPFSLIIGLLKSRKLPILVARMETSLGGALPTDITWRREAFRAFIIGWNLVYVVLGLVAYYMSFREISAMVNRIVEDFLYEIHFYYGPRTPPYLFTVLMGVMMFLNLSFEAFPVTLVLTLLRAINRGFQNINKEIGRLLKDPGREDAAVTLKALREQYLRLQCHTEDADDIFSYLILIGWVREFLGFIAIMGALMQTSGEEEIHTKEDANTAVIDESTRHMVYGFGIMGLVNMVMKLTISVCTHDEAQAVRVNLRKLLARSTSPVIQQECGAFILECEESDGAITAGGFFRITREAASSLAEMMITYVLVIYQAHDTKQDIAELPTKSEMEAFRKEMRQRTEYCTVSRWNATTPISQSE